MVIHDAARPLAVAAMFAGVIEAAYADGGALPVCEQPALLPLAGAAPEHRRTVAVQTPQAFQARPLLAAYRAAAAEGFEGTDTAACFELYADGRVAAVSSGPGNLKITFPDDIGVAQRLS